MEKTGLIPDYAEFIARGLSFDRSLAQRVRQEVEDHLREAAVADPRSNALEAERRAIADFGNPHVIVAQFAIVSLMRQTAKVGVAVLLMVAGVLIAMKARVAWYAVAHWEISNDLRAVSGTIGLIDRCASWISVAVGIAAWLYIRGRRTPAVFCPTYQKELRRCFFLCMVATGALIASVISDALLTALRLVETEPSDEFLVPVVSMAIEIACAGILTLWIWRMARRTAAITSFLRT
jgi:hypothetical protein